MSKEKIIIDVREQDEFESGHIPNSINVPLSKIDRIQSYAPLLSGKEVCLVCQSGKRAGMAKSTLDSHKISCDVYEGGILKWQSEHGVLNTASNRISIFRQVQIIVGFLVAIFSFLALYVDHRFVFGTLVLGSALCMAGLFGFCLLATVLKRLPWNR